MALASIVPMLPAQDLAASVAFYCQLGFEVESLREDWGWAAMALGSHRIMLDRSIGSGAHACSNSVVYLYADDLDQFWRSATEAGLAPPDICETFYGMREFRVLDPSGNQIWVGQARA
jgi:uncharacterized glyoxalase superfamily protein PhnB